MGGSGGDRGGLGRSLTEARGGPPRASRVRGIVEEPPDILVSAAVRSDRVAARRLE